MNAQSESRPEAPAVAMTEETTDAQIRAQLEPAIQVALASGQVADEKNLRKNLEGAARDFRSMLSGIQDDPETPWFFSRMRVDFVADVSGHVTPAITVGNESRFRFEWFRIQRTSKHNVANRLPSTKPQASQAAKMGKNLEAFVRNMVTDLTAVSEELEERSFFQAHQIRFGIGISVQGTIGIAKTTGNVVGQVYFNRNVKRPVIYPVRDLLAARESSQSVVVLADREDRSTPTTQAFASANGISFEEQVDHIAYRVDREQFRKGLKKAFRLGRFFAQQAEKSDKKGRDARVRILRDGLLDPKTQAELFNARGLKQMA